MGKCQQCNMPVNVVIGHGTNPEQVPKVGDFTVCSTCGQVGTFDADLNILPATEEQLDATMDKWPEVYMQMTVASYYINQLFQLKCRNMKKLFIDIHKALHNPKQKQIKINGIPTEIQTNTQGVRFVTFKDDGNDWEIVQQNPQTRSAYAQRAREGEKISWLIPHYFGYRKGDGWKVITDSTSIL